MMGYLASFVLQVSGEKGYDFENAVVNIKVKLVYDSKFYSWKKTQKHYFSEIRLFTL